MTGEEPRPLEPFDEIDRTDLEAVGFSISDDNRRAWLETEVLIELIKLERRVHYKLLITLPNGAVVEADAPRAARLPTHRHSRTEGYRRKLTLRADDQLANDTEIDRLVEKGAARNARINGFEDIHSHLNSPHVFSQTISGGCGPSTRR